MRGKFSQNHFWNFFMLCQKIKGNFQRFNLRVTLQELNQSIDDEIELFLLNVVSVFLVRFSEEP